ncbi:MAG: hypothetical protein ACYC2H_09960 [Thermoplasmatota archaeon]
MTLARAILTGLRVAAAVAEAGRDDPPRPAIETRQRPDGVWEAVL